MSKNKKTSIGCLFWLALVLLVIVIFLFNQKNIEEVIKRTGFWDIFTSNDEPVDIIIVSDDSDNIEETPEDNITDDTTQNISININDDGNHVTSEEDAENNKPTTTIDSNTQDVINPEKTNLRNAKLYFVKVNEDGTFSIAGTSRPVYYNDSPLRETLITLLNGQSTSEISQGLLTMISNETVLRNVYVRENTAFIDFSDNFLFNRFSHEGLIIQLKQVVYTATEFQNINNVQILIEGKIQEYLSTEGFYMGGPLSRDSF